MLFYCSIYFSIAYHVYGILFTVNNVPFPTWYKSACKGLSIRPEVKLTTSRRLTCIHAKPFPTVKRRTCIHVLRHYFRNSYSLADMPFSWSPAGHACETPDKRHCKQSLYPTPVPLSDQPGTWIDKYFSIVRRAFVMVSLAVWSTRPCWIIGCCVSTSDGPDFITKDRHCSKSSHWKLKMSMRKRFYFGVLI